MNILPLTRDQLDPRVGIGTLAATAIAVLAVAATIVFIALPIGGHKAASNAAPKHPVARSQPQTHSSASGQTLIHYYGTGAPPHIQHGSLAPRTPSRAYTTQVERFYGGRWP